MKYCLNGAANRGAPIPPSSRINHPSGSPGLRRSRARRSFRPLTRCSPGSARLGHSSTLVSCRAAQDGPASTRPGCPEAPTALCASASRAKASSTGLSSPSQHITEKNPGHCQRRCSITSGPPPCVRHPLAGRCSAATGMSWAFAGDPLPAAPQALALTRAARAALLHHAGEPVPEAISGHQDGGRAGGPTPPLEKPHLAVIPLLNAGHPQSDGTIYGIAFVLPAECTGEDRAAVEDALRSWAAADRRSTDEFMLRLPAEPGRRPVEYALMDLGIDRGLDGPASEWLTTSLTSRRKTTTRDYWCRPARRWLTVTPVALDRFPGNLLSRDPAPATGPKEKPLPR